MGCRKDGYLYFLDFQLEGLLETSSSIQHVVGTRLE